MVMRPRLRARPSLAPQPILSIVSVTIGSGSNFMPPSSSRKRMTTPLKARPAQRAAFEMLAFELAVSAKIVMACSVSLVMLLALERTRSAETDNRREDFLLVMPGLDPGIHVLLCFGHKDVDGRDIQREDAL